MANESFPLSITLGAIDRATAPLARFASKVERIFAPFQKIGARLRVFSDTAGFPKVARGLEGLGSALGGVGREVSRLAFRFGTLATGAAAGALLIVRAYGEAGDEIAKTARKLGIGVETLQELRFAGKREGIDQAALDKGLELFTRGIGDAALGLGTARVAFEALGVSVTDSDGKMRPFDALLEEVSDKLARVEDQNLRNALAAKLFGRSGAELNKLLQLGSGAIAELRAEARRLGLVLSEEATAAAEEFSDRTDDLSAALLGVRNRLAGAVLPWLSRFAEKATAFLVRVQPKVEEFAARFMERLPERLERLQASFAALVEDARPWLDFLGDVLRKLGPARSAALALAVVFGGPLVLAIGSVVAAFATLSTALLTTPVGWVILGVAALAGVLISNWETVGPFFTNLFADLKSGWQGFLDWLDPKLVSLFDRVNEFMEGGRIGEFLRGFLGSGRTEEERLRDARPNPPPTPAEREESRRAIERIYGGPSPTGGPAPIGSLRVTFENTPPGTRVREDRNGGIPLDLDLGYSMAGQGLR